MTLTQSPGSSQAASSVGHTASPSFLCSAFEFTAWFQAGLVMSGQGTAVLDAECLML